MKTVIFILLLLGHTACAQQKIMREVTTMQELIETHQYTIYNGDTFNRIDALSRKQGAGILIIKDSQEYHLMYVHCDDCPEQTSQYRDSSWFEYSIRCLAFGNYSNNLKQGNWRYCTKNGITRMQVNYQNDSALGQVLYFYENGALMAKGHIIPSAEVVEFKKYNYAGLERETMLWFVDDILMFNGWPF